MELVKEIAEKLCKEIGQIYPASIEEIHGEKRPVYFDGVEFKNLLPVDNDCDVVYVREIGESQFEDIDLGGCTPSIFVKSTIRIVVYSKTLISNFAYLQKVVNALSSFNTKLIASTTNMDILLSKESGKKTKNLKLKNCSYFAFDFSIRKEINNCNVIKEC